MGAGTGLSLESGWKGLPYGAGLLAPGTGCGCTLGPSGKSKGGGPWGQRPCPHTEEVNPRTSPRLALQQASVPRRRCTTVAEQGRRGRYHVSAYLLGLSDLETESLFLHFMWKTPGPEIPLGCTAQEKAITQGRFEDGKRQPFLPLFAFGPSGFALCIHKCVYKTPK